jgi:ribosomal-protein-alanine N-acetyltransferase
VGAEAAPLIAAMTDESTGESWSENAVAGILAQAGSFGFVVHMDERPAGFILARVAADESEIINLVVAAGARRQGVGRLLLSTTLVRARALGAGSMFLEVARDNEAALALYDEFGFIQVGIRSNYYRRGTNNYTDAFILRRDLITGGRDPD